MTQLLVGLAQQAPSAQTPAPGGLGAILGNPMTLMVLMFGIFYFLVIRPQSKKAKLHQQMLSSLKKGDDVVTTGGILGRITGIKDDEVTLQVQEGVRIRVLRSAVQGMQRPPSTEPAKAEAKAPS